MEKSLKSIAINFGLYLGGLLALLTVVAYAVDLELLTNMWYGVFMLIAIIVLGIISVGKTKQAQDGYASFKEAFTAFFITVVLGLVISTFVSYILFNFIDTEAANVLKEKTIEKTVEMLKGFNTPSEVIAQSVEQIESQNQYSIGNILKGLAGYTVFFSIIGLIVAAALKKNKPKAE
ncbi:DUF4199 domain-containing protein [Siansivirga zeaxanthinifaciens]|uniref:DUF4199 domain-containing protein n=1 Tax=Siansivirga zeaxanthinifaciens CC-SAMT-1 TaxID=1454006 RepID=A0A0C5VWH5_9FLAO|nr:DUF4199 domain-containing protein [Siansivirga zeaxanthinifaciens]AJR03476.1 hypothetical protein AW14_07375 [Siansivirga zeaxanthinifaciens CC-SAMT-1]